MGYFDNIENKMNNIQEMGDIDRLAGNAFWFNIGSFGVFAHAMIAFFVFWTQFGSIQDLASGSASGGVGGTTGVLIVVVLCFVFSISVFLGVVGLIFSVKAHKALAFIREKNSLNSMSASFNLLWIVLDVIFVALNIMLCVVFIAQNL